MQNPFIWGAGGKTMTPEQVERQRALAALQASRAGDTSPVGHWTAGMARVVDALAGRLREGRADRAEQEGLASADAAIQGNPVLAALLGGDQVTMQTPDPIQIAPGMSQAPQEARSAPGADAIRAGLVQRGLPGHVADAFVMNFQDESGLNPGINEAAPIVPGSRGGYGLAQWTGPRRRQLEAFAAQRGTPVSDTDTQLDFLMSELQGSEAGAAQSILSAQDAPTAAAAIVNKFLRPAEEHRARREAAYLGGSEPATGAQAPIGMPAPQQGPSPVLAALAQAQSNPWVAQKYGPVIQALMGQEMQRSNAQYAQQLRQSDPAYQLDLQRAQMELDQMRNPTKPIEVGGVLLDPTTYEPIFDSRQSGQGSMPAEVQALAWRAEQAGLKPGTQEYQDFIMNGGSRGTGVPAGFAALDAQAKAAGLIEGSPEYQDFMLGAGAGQRAQATAVGKARGEAQMDLGGAIDKAQRAIANLEAVRDDPSLPSITGMVQGRLPPMSQAGTDLNTRIEQAQGQAFLEAFESLKGGGQITEVEGLKAEKAIARLNRAQSTEAYQHALNDLIDVLNAGVARAHRRAGVPSGAPQADTTDDDLLRKYGG